MLKHFHIIICCASLVLASYIPIHALNPQTDVRFHCEQDTLKIAALIEEGHSRQASLQELVPFFAQILIGAPYEANTLDGKEEKLTLNVDSFDDKTFVETVLALAIASHYPNPGWREFAYSLEKTRYRRGEMDGYASRLHYVSDWVADNIYRGQIKDITHDLGQVHNQVKSLDYMTSHPELFPALSDSLNFDKIRMVEMGYHAHKIPYLKKETIGKSSTVNLLRDGDIIIFLGREPGLDAQHIGFVKIVDGEAKLLHASPSSGKVEVMPRSVKDYFKHEGRNLVGFRVLRIDD